MSTLHQELQRRVAADQEKAAQDALAVERAKKAAEIAEWERLERLAKNPDFQWLLDEFQKQVQIHHDAALDANASDDAANKARHRHKVAKDLHDMLASRHEQMKNRLFEEPKPS